MLARDWWVGDTVGAKVRGEWDPDYHVNVDGYFIGANVGSLTFDRRTLNVTVHDLHSGTPRLAKVMQNTLHPSAPTRLPLDKPTIPDFYRYVCVCVCVCVCVF